MFLETGNVIERRRGRRHQLSTVTDTEYWNTLIGEYPNNAWFRNRIDSIFFVLLNLHNTMHHSTKAALIAVAILACVIGVILLINTESIKSGIVKECININAEETCLATETNPYRFFGTKTAYHVAQSNDDSSEYLNTAECEPMIFYLLCRHATRYPDKKGIQNMIYLLPKLQEIIVNASDEVRICKKDLENLEKWTEKLKPEFDNKITSNGIKETIDLAKRFKAKFPMILDKEYYPERFIFEYTSRERTRSTAEAFASGLFGEDYKKINFENRTNDKVLQFHKKCDKIKLQRSCNSTDFDISEIQEFENGSLMQDVVNSVSERIGVGLTLEEITVIYRACVFGYVLETGDAWCSLFSTDELKVLEFNDDIDDYYKDAYGNRINHEQACTAVEHVMDIFNTFKNASETKAIMQFSHAGGIKKVFSAFGLFKDDQHLTADSFCLQQNRKWRSSFIAPFTANMAFVMYKCGSGYKIAAFHNEKPVQIGGCSSKLCSFDEFYNSYNPIAKDCDLQSICGTCSL